jgi:cytidine deaminase
METTSADGVPASPSVAECGHLVEAASGLIDEREGSANHTVAAVALDADGHLHGAVNVHHFTGGPCAELVAIGVAAAATSAPLVAMVAVGDRGRGVMSPCGRCRQVMLDYFPNIKALVFDGAAVRAVPIRELLPWSFDRHEQQATGVRSSHSSLVRPR